MVARGVKAVTGLDMPVFDKCRFQHGAPAGSADALFPAHEATYRRAFHALYES